MKVKAKDVDSNKLLIDSLENIATDLTKRDLFAAMAMQAILKDSKLTELSGAEYQMSHAVMFADALIAELDKEKESEK